ncbi:MAG: hypothetical protein JJE49_03960 [Peptostreptococcaceae bacterium]|nr:hypothetical protein [Peptostreptococcaceae bacterium]
MAKVKNEIIFIPKIKVHPNKIILFNEIHYTHHKPARKNDFKQNTSLITQKINGKLELVRVNNSFLNSSRQSGGTLSKQAKKKLSTAIEYFLMLNKPQNGKSGNTGRHYQNKIAFITLTLPSKQIHSDNEIKVKCLNQFLIELSKYHKVSNYVWRSEYQKNGNIHFHILVNRFVAWNDIRNRWNRIVNKLGYIDNYKTELENWHKKGFTVRTELLKTWPLESQIKAYEKGKKSDWHNPNSIDVHGLNNITNIKSYITKYLTKEEAIKEGIVKNPLEDRKNIGRIWSSSVIFANITGATTEVDSVIEENLRTIEEHFKKSVYRSEYFTIISISIEEVEKTGCTALIELFYNYMYDQFQFSHQLTAQYQ